MPSPRMHLCSDNSQKPGSPACLSEADFLPVGVKKESLTLQSSDTKLA